MDNVAVAGAELPSLGLGTWKLAGEECQLAVEEALRIGYRHIDTAQRYHNEAEVGAGIQASSVPREDIFLTTKLDIGNAGKEMVRPTVERSLRALQTDYVDLLLIHWPEPGVPVETSLEAMAQMQAAGVVRHLGVCNFPPSLLERACRVTRLVTNQVEYHPFLSQDALLELCARHDLVLTAFAPLARGRALTDATILDVARRHDRSPAQVTLRWLLQQPRVAAIPRSSSLQHLRMNAAVFDFSLTSDDMRRIAERADGLRLVDPPHAPDWER